ncbi:MAG TPA: response regulator transcription factor [Ktedonobacterales bacterium]|nr:response regulator transcription factor [Ktedonobacterales bacterium]
MAVILIVEDDRAMSDLLHSHLIGEGYAVEQVYDGPTALASIEQHPPDLIILDWMLPGMDGLALCRQVRQRYLMPIIMLTARTEEIDEILGLEVGADDYITKPFSIRQVLARVRANLRRVELENQRSNASGANASTSSQNANDLLALGSLTINLPQRLIKINDQEVDLTPKEFDLLVLLVSHPGWVFKREVILQQIWGDEYEGFDRTIDNHVTRLRRKLGDVGEKIDTVWGVGYRFTA